MYFILKFLSFGQVTNRDIRVMFSDNEGHCIVSDVEGLKLIKRIIRAL